MAESGKRKGGGLAVFVNDSWCNSGHITVKEQVCSKDIELLAVSMRPYYLLREFTQVIVFTLYIALLLKLMQLVMFFTQSQAHCRHSSHRPSSSSLGTLIMPLCPPLCPHSHNMSPATPETIKHWTYCMSTSRRHTTHPPSLPVKI